MKSYLVKDLMVPLSEYATVTEDATLYEAVLALEEAQEKFEDKHTRYRHRAILMLDKEGDVVGKLSQLDVLRSLEPKYQEMIEGRGLAPVRIHQRVHEIDVGGLSSFCRSPGGYLPQSRRKKCQRIYVYTQRGRICARKTHLWMKPFIS